MYNNQLHLLKYIYIYIIKWSLMCQKYILNLFNVQNPTIIEFDWYKTYKRRKSSADTFWYLAFLRLI